MPAQSASAAQTISLPQGGGAIHGIGEKFSPDLFTGTGNFSVPIALPPGRNGFQPQLNLVYSTGNGQGAFGLGWSLSVPGVSRKTSNGVPRYFDHASIPERDTFILSGAEDLVAVEDTETRTCYRPRTEGLFARITHHHDPTQRHDYWEVCSKDGLVSFYGTPGSAGVDSAALTNPADRRKVFEWKLSRTLDPFGNQIVYEYERDTGTLGGHCWNQLYLKHIHYVDYKDSSGTLRFLVTVTFDYGEPSDERPDPLSSYRSGFEIRTRKRCRQILVTTDDGHKRPIRAYRLTYHEAAHNRASLLAHIQLVGYDDKGQLCEELPPLAFGYTQFVPQQRKFSPVCVQSLPETSLANPSLELVDLLGNGLPDILELSNTARYWRNLGGGRFDCPRPMGTVPAGMRLDDPDVSMLDANGDGRMDLLVSKDGMSGYYPLQSDARWDEQSFQRLVLAPSFSLEDPEVRLVDLDGDGITDAIRSGSRMECFFNRPENGGWQKLIAVERQLLKVFPNVNFSDPRVKWSDMSGDGLQDVVLVHDGSVEYWPNLGYGNWGPRITMRNSPHFPYGYDLKRVLLGDVDGDGLADLVYVAYGEVTLWINQGGDGWSQPIRIIGTPSVTDIDSVRLTDLYGAGISGVLWSAEADGQSRQRMSFLDFTGGVKPYLLNEMDNQIGAMTKVEYAPSTRFYLADEKHPATRWKTTLPFPVQVVARVEVIDSVSRGKLTTEYSYHHGYWDGAEREFRGFGMVERRDTEAFGEYNQPGLHGDDAQFNQIVRVQFAPPMLTKTWFHQGPVGAEFGDWQEIDSTGEFWGGDPQRLARPPEVQDALKNLPRRAKRDALRALRGQIVRTELYALDGSQREDQPYTVTESLSGVREIDPPQPADHDRLRIFFPYPIAQRTTQWERGDDPLTQFAFTDYLDEHGQFDRYGRPHRQTAVACPRGWRTMSDLSNAYLATRTSTEYATPADADQHYIHDRVTQAASYEIANEIPRTVGDMWQLPDTHAAVQLIGQTLHFYDCDPTKLENGAFEGLPLGQLGRYGALVRTEQLVLTDAVLQAAYGPDLPPYLIPGDAPAWTEDYPTVFRSWLGTRPGGTGYHTQLDAEDVGYFIASERRRYDFHTSADGSGRGLLLTQRDPIGGETAITYDQYALLPIEVRQIIDPDASAPQTALTTTAEYNYRVMQPRLVTDPNGNQREFRFSPLGLPAEIWVHGKPGDQQGDQQCASTVLTYDFLAFKRSRDERREPAPIFVRTIRRVDHDTEEGASDEAIEKREFSDGVGRLIQTRTQAEDLVFGDDQTFGNQVLPPEQPDAGYDVVGQTVANPAKGPRVVVSGWQVHDNKGRVVEKYEPFFAEGWEYTPPEGEQFGCSVRMYYDPRGHAICTINPDGSEQRVVYGAPRDPGDLSIVQNDPRDVPEGFRPTPWEVYTYDADDNAGRTHGSTDAGYQHQWDTPASVVIDALGRTIHATARNRRVLGDGSWGPVEEYHTVSTYDIRGNLLTVTDPLGRVAFRHVYDLANRPLRVECIDAGIHQTVIDAAGNPIERRDSKGALLLTSYDRLNRPLAVWARDGTDQPLTLRQQLVYGDDPGSGLAWAPAGDKNLRGRLYRHYDEAGLLAFEAYDFKGNLVEKIRRVVADEQILAVFEQAPKHDWHVTAYRIDWQPPEDTMLDDYAQSILSPAEYRSSTAYDALNRVKLLTYPQTVEGGRSELRPYYNRAGALEHVELDRAPYVQRIAYNARGQRTLIAYGNRIMTCYAYEKDTFRLARLRTERYQQPDEFVYKPDGGVLQDFAYSYDLAGNILAIQDQTPECGVGGTAELKRKFTYDPIYQLVSANGRECDIPPSGYPWNDHHDQPHSCDRTRTRAYEETYAYDKAGNTEQIASTTGPTRTFTLMSGSNRLQALKVGQTRYAYEYDASGNLTHENTERHYEWDHADRLRVFRVQPEGAEPSIHAHYLYDVAGQRVMKLVRRQGGAHDVTIYIDGIFEYHRRVEAGRPLEHNTLHIMDNQSRIATVCIGEPFPNDGAPDMPVKYHLGDHLGSSGVVVGGQDVYGQEFINREEFYPYGETSFGSFGRKRYRFTGKERDEESGLNYHGARYYAPWLVRWMSCDPAGSGENSMHLYAYVKNKPTIFFDRTGNEEESSLCGEIIKGDFYQGESTWTGTFANVGIGLIPIVGQVADVRDTAAAIRNVWNDPRSWGNWGQLGLAVAGWVPGFGDTLKGGSKVVRKTSKEVLSGGAKAANRLEHSAQEVASKTAGTLKVRKGNMDLDDETKQILSNQSPSDIDIGPFKDPAGRTYKGGFSPEDPVVDHVRARAAGGSPTDSNNLDIKSRESNAVKGGREGALLRYEEYLRQNGMSEDEIRAVTGPEWDSIMRDVHAVSIDPELLKTLGDAAAD